MCDKLSMSVACHISPPEALVSAAPAAPKGCQIPMIFLLNFFERVSYATISDSVKPSNKEKNFST